MTLFDTASPIDIGIWDATVDVPGRRVSQKALLWDSWVTFPPRRPRPAPRVRRQVRELLAWTGWSARTLAELVGTTHPTISAIAAGRPSAFTRAPELPSRLAQLHGLLERLNLVASGDSVELNRLLSTPPAEGEPNALDHVAVWDLTGAWLAASDVASPRRTSRMMQGRFPAQPGHATTALHE